MIKNFSSSEYAAVFAEMADILSVPPDEFLSSWVAAFDQRATGGFPTTEDAIRDLSLKLNPWVTDARIKEATQIRLDYTKRSFIPRNGAIEVLSYLREAEYKVGLISDCTCEIPNVWDSTPFAPLFDVTIFSCVARIKKPDPRIYLLATEQLGVESQDCLYIGDGSSRELTGALQVGMHPVLVRNPEEDRNDVYRTNFEGDNWPGPVISSLKEVLGLLKQ